VDTVPYRHVLFGEGYRYCEETAIKHTTVNQSLE
jgi:hypothetical protein